ncbi:MAG: TlpA family protein disulfide reductase [Acidobacteria bacterium]|nr:TlpA family protein disulfide reductase [Acidobacteriota bacterium]
MKNKQALMIFLIVFLLSIVAIQFFRSPGAVAAGNAAPQFTLQDMAGREVSLDDYRGKVVILDFWATWCGPCRMTMPMLDEIQEEYNGKISVLAINLKEPKGVVREYILQQDLRSEVLLDEDGSVGSRYGAAAIPMQFLIDQNGIVRDILTGFSPGMGSRIREEINKLL